MTGALIVVGERVAYERFCSRTLIERHVEHLRRAGISDVRVVTTSELDSSLAGRETTDRTAIVTAERIFDPRLYQAIVDHHQPVCLTDHGVPVGMEMIRGSKIRPTAPIDGTATATAGVARLDLRSLDPYSRELRRRLPPYWMRVSGPNDRPAVTRLLVEASGKGHQDLPAMVLNAPLEKALMRRLANTRVTPNQLTAICNLLAYAVAALLATGQLLAGAVGALVVGVVDGLDGRQARVQLRTTPLGRLEHLLDKIYEVLWIVALAYSLSDRFADRSQVTRLMVWIAAYLLDTAAYDLVKWRTGATLDEASPVDAVIRMVAGRRNVYACMLLAGVLAGSPGAAFRAMVGWAVVTAAVHWVRAIMVIRHGQSRVLV
jgi:phosphatidylglycerophosphate synthase